MDYVLNISLLALGFGFVIFWHELGHFLAAKYVGIRVEQFAVGFGHAMLAWRKGVGARVGTTRPEYERRIRQHLNQKQGVTLDDDQPLSSQQLDEGTRALKLGETEYRLNWIPLGGYVKMLGQDDMNPNAVSDDPRAYPQKSVGARMLVISAGVIMNIILAALLFMGLFMYGHKVPPAVVGGVQPLSPASQVTRTVDGKPVTTSLRVGDEILFLDGTRQDDWTKVTLTTALADPSEPTPIRVRHLDGSEVDYMIRPTASGEGRTRDLLQLGISQPVSLRGPPPGTKVNEAARALAAPDSDKLGIGDAIVAVEGKPVNPGEAPTESKASEYHVLDTAVQKAGREGRNVKLDVRRKDGQVQSIKVTPRLVRFFGETPLNFAGLLPRTTVVSVEPDSPASEAGMRPKDVIVNIVSANDPEPDPTFDRFRNTLKTAGAQGQDVTITVLRGEGERVPLRVKPGIKQEGWYIIGFGQGFDAEHPVVAGTVEGSPAFKAGIPNGAKITAIGGKAVANWHDIHRLIAEAPVGQPLEITGQTSAGEPLAAQLVLSEADRAAAEGARYAVFLEFDEHTFLRKAANPAQAAWLGVTETRDFILQFYVTLQRMFGGSISPRNLMGPVGIFQAGTSLAFRGPDWLVWFLAMISANLAVVNFLPIPVVDGGHFVFLLYEKIKGKPASQRIQSIAQVVGLALLLGVFVLVTYQDISRMITRF